MPFYVDAILSYMARFPMLLDSAYLLNSKSGSHYYYYYYYAISFENSPWLNQCILLSAPQLFNVVLNVVIPLTDPITRDSIKTHGKNRNIWEPIVRKQIDPSQLPERFGGYF